MVRLGLVPAYLLLCLVLGGASAAGFWSNLVLQLVALALIFWSLVAERSTPLSTSSRQAGAILLLTLLLIALQLVPLPPALWTALPGRAPVAEGYALLGRPLPWLPLSLEPYRTIDSALWLLPAVAVFLGIARLGAFKASWMGWILAGTTLVSVAIGALQVAGGTESRWYFYKITNYDAMTGFFSNANHLATLLVATIPFLTALYLSAVRRGRSVQKSSALLVILIGTLVVVFVGILVNRSIAGIGLSVPVLAASGLLLLSRKRRLPVWAAPLMGVLLVGSVAAAFSTPFNNNLTGDQSRTAEDSRRISFARTAAAAADFAPLGSGIGTFQQVYREREDPAQVGRFFMNHAHGDYLELALETGLPGLLVLLLFLAWWTRRTIALWRAEEADYFARAATIASAAILAHSVVDYPLRTAAIGAVFAMCCALMAEPRAKVRRAQAQPADKQARHLSAD
ncbi:MAG: O-antigen ligase family protein [Alphaproteobacteria bacterium]|nr:O-antigen ligase family protein [Alphaproteobacteria bacterium]MBV9373105.1 O-antigen ligase family protein [Alphaproteobacteria bacterium]MBV9902865.1 O-antigen ligase family protein [Alphaproteobacteria bacterium]